MDTFTVTVGAGSLRPLSGVFEAEHRWTSAGVAVEGAFTGAHLLHAAVAGCVLNDLYREAAARSLRLEGVRVRAEGAFDPETWRSTGITYRVELETDASVEEQSELLAVVDEAAEVPRALRAGTTVRRV